jgi:hypothetical protein
MKTIHTSESLKKQDGHYENYHYQLEDGEQYMLTEGEIGWLDFVKGKYSIYDHIMNNSHCDDDNNLIYTVETIGMGQALHDDGIGCKAVCLDDETALQAIFFYSHYEPEVEE